LQSRDAITAAIGKIESALERDPANPALLFQAAAARLQAGDAAGVLALHDRLAAAQPPSAEQAVQKAVALRQLGRIPEAEATLLDAAAREPFYFQSHALLGQLWAATGEHAKALAYFASLVERMPDSRGARSIYARFLLQAGRSVDAEAQWRAVLRLVPDDESALEPLLELLEKRPNDDGLQLMLAAHRYNPRSFPNNARLVAVFDKKGDRGQAVKFMRDLAASGPVNAMLYRDLAVHLRELGRLDEARVAVHQAREAARRENNTALLETLDRLLPGLGVSAGKK
jgi:tetratricopeptide (TPR) repeat protein